MDAEEAGWSCEEAGAVGCEARGAGCETKIVGFWKTVKIGEESEGLFVGGETEEKGLAETA